MTYCYVDAPEFFKETKQRARKPHVCVECGRKILAGEMYWRSTGKWEGVVDTFRQHPWCRAACTHLSRLQEFEECVPFGAMLDVWGEVYQPEAHPRLRDFIARAMSEMANPNRIVAC